MPFRLQGRLLDNIDLPRADEMREIPTRRGLDRVGIRLDRRAPAHARGRTRAAWTFSSGKGGGLSRLQVPHPLLVVIFESLTQSKETCVIDLADDILGPALFRLLAASRAAGESFEAPFTGCALSNSLAGKGGKSIENATAPQVHFAAAPLWADAPTHEINDLTPSIREKPTPIGGSRLIHLQSF